MLKFNTLREVEEFAMAESQGPMAYGEIALLNNGLQVIRGKDGFYYLDLSYEQNQALETAKQAHKKSYLEARKESEEQEEAERAERRASYAEKDAEHAIYRKDTQASVELQNYIERQYGCVTGVTVLGAACDILKSRVNKTYKQEHLNECISVAKERVALNRSCKIHKYAREAIEWCENM